MEMKIAIAVVWTLEPKDECVRLGKRNNAGGVESIEDEVVPR